MTVNQIKGISELELRWLSGASGSGRGKAGDKLSVFIAGKQKGPYTLAEDPTVALEDYCQYADINRLWAGRVKVVVP